jgi:hypothetical protein
VGELLAESGTVAVVGDMLPVCRGIASSSLPVVVAVVDRLAACWVSELGSSSLLALEAGDIVEFVLELSSVLNSGVLLERRELEVVEGNIGVQQAVRCNYHIVDIQEEDLDTLVEAIDN